MDSKILRYVLALVNTVILGIYFEPGSIIVKVRPYKNRKGHVCPICGERHKCYDHLETRRWRALDIGRMRCYLEYAPVRVDCPKDGVRVEEVPWARPKSRFTRDFEDWVACLTIHSAKSWVSRQARVEWHTIGNICKRVYDEIEAARGVGRFDGLRRIGIDETSYKKGHKYLTVVVDHDRGCIVWCHEGYGKEVLSLFLDELTREQRRSIEVVTADGARWIKSLVKRKCPNAKWVMDPFHVVSWMNDALDEVRRDEWQAAKSAAAAARPKKGEGPATKEYKDLSAKASAIKNSRYALVKNPEDLTEAQKRKLEELRKASKKAGNHLFRTWELKEDLRAVFKAETAEEAAELLAAWLHDAAYCKIKPVVAVEKKVRRRRDDIVEAVRLGISNGRVESLNQKIKTLVKVGYGFRNTDNLIALIMLSCSDEQPVLPWEDRKEIKRKRDERKEKDRQRDRERRKRKAATAA